MKMRGYTVHFIAVFSFLLIFTMFQAFWLHRSTGAEPLLNPVIEGGTGINIVSVMVAKKGQSLPAYLMLATAMNSMYALAQNHSFRIFQHSFGHEAHWVKIAAVRDELRTRNPQYVIFLDGDAAFRSPLISLREIIRKEMGAQHIFLVAAHRNKFAQTCNMSDMDFNCQGRFGEECKQTWSCNPNTGVWVIKNSPKAVELLDTWLASKPPGDKFIMEDGANFLFDQSGFIMHVLPKYRQEIRVVDADVLNIRNSKAIVHELGRTESQRNGLFHQYLDTFLKRIPISKLDRVQPNSVPVVWQFRGAEKTYIHSFCDWVEEDFIVRSKPGHKANSSEVAKLLEKIPKATLVDLDYDGTFSVSAAKLGYSVLVIEPLWKKLRQLCHPVSATKTGAKVTLVYAPISHNLRADWIRGNNSGDPSRKNDGTVLNDVQSLVKTKSVVLKIGFGQFTTSVLESGEIFFERLNVGMVLFTSWDHFLYPNVSAFLLSRKYYQETASKMWPNGALWLKADPEKTKSHPSSYLERRCGVKAAASQSPGLRHHFSSFHPGIVTRDIIVDPLVCSLQNAIYDLQFRLCNAQSSVLAFGSLQTGSGIGSRWHTRVRSVRAGWNLNLTVAYVGLDSRPFSYFSHKNCPDSTENCFFQNLSSCKGAFTGNPRLNASWQVQPISFPENSVQKKFEMDRGKGWVDAQLFLFTIQPKPLLIRWFFDFWSQENGPYRETRKPLSNASVSREYLAMHIRWGDKCQKEAQCRPVDDYVAAAESFRLKYGVNNMVLSSESSTPFQDVLHKKLLPEWQISWIPSNNVGADQRKFMSENEIFRRNQSRVDMTALQLSMHANFLICTASSNWCRTIFYLSTGFYGSHPNHLFMDEWGHSVLERPVDFSMQFWGHHNLSQIVTMVIVRNNLVHFGSAYGGWYTWNHLDEESVVYGFGVGADLTWDLALVKRFNLTVHEHDNTPASVAWVAKQTLPQSVLVHPFLLGSFDGSMKIALPTSHGTSYAPLEANAQGFRTTPIELPCRTIYTRMRELNHSRVDLLKIDVEGAEFDIVDSWGKFGKLPVCQLLIEFHVRLFKSDGALLKKNAMETLSKLGFQTVYDKTEKDAANNVLLVNLDVCLRDYHDSYLEGESFDQKSPSMVS